MNAGSEWIVGLVNLDSAKLFNFTDGTAFCFVGYFLLAQAVVTEPPARLQHGIETRPLGSRGIQTIAENLVHSNTLFILLVFHIGSIRTDGIKSTSVGRG